MCMIGSGIPYTDLACMIKRRAKEVTVESHANRGTYVSYKTFVDFHGDVLATALAKSPLTDSRPHSKLQIPNDVGWPNDHEWFLDVEEKTLGTHKSGSTEVTGVAAIDGAAAAAIADRLTPEFAARIPGMFYAPPRAKAAPLVAPVPTDPPKVANATAEHKEKVEACQTGHLKYVC